MRINRPWICVVICCVLFATLFSGCNSSSRTNDDCEVTMDYYNEEDFQTLIIGESTATDVYKIAPISSMLATSYGGLIDYPLKNGGYVRIKYYGKDLVVGKIEVFPMADEIE